MPGRRWSDGLHQAVEAKEGVKIEEENQTLATITFQNYFRMYTKLAGMTGTADTEAEEFAKIYKLDVRRHPDEPADRPQGLRGRRLQDRAREVRRGRRGDREAPREGPAGPRRHRLGREERGRLHAPQAARHPAQRPQREAARARGRDRRAGRPQGRGHHLHQHGRPRHRHHPRRQPRDDGEARGRARARRCPWRARRRRPSSRARPSGRGGSSSASRELKAQTAKEHEEVVGLGGLHIVGTERHESRRIDNQLRGRAGRQGDPGSSQLLPVARGRPDAHLRVRADPGPHGDAWA